jgi:DNA polymerase III subunit epsilon
MPPDVLATAGALVVAALVAVATALLWPQAPQALAAAVVAVVAVAWLFVSVLAARFAAIERVRDGVVVLAATGGPVPAAWTADPSGPEGRLAAAVAELAALERARAGRDAAASARRLEAVVAGLDAGVLAVAPNGLIALANGAAAAALGERVRVGTSVFDAIHRHAVLAASAAARAAGRPVPVSLDPVGGGTPIEARVGPLPDGDGIVILLPAAFAAAPRLDLDASLLDRAPGGPAPDDATPLADLAAIALDTETTGLDPRRDRVLSVGAVRMHGVRVFRADTLDLLVDPGVPIPPASSRIHGLTDQTVAGAPPIAAVLDRIADACRNRVVVGHNIGFDLAILAAEAARSGHRWSPPPTLDTLALAAALDPVRADLDLDALAPASGIVPAGRHTALGDALLTADLFVRFLPLLAERGVTTLGAARALAAAQTKVRRAQAEAGW